MQTIARTFSIEKETKNTIKYQEEPTADGPALPPAIGTIYIQKWAAGSPPPQSIVVCVEADA